MSRLLSGSQLRIHRISQVQGDNQRKAELGEVRCQSQAKPWACQTEEEPSVNITHRRLHRRSAPVGASTKERILH